jgi:hypothetical protein
MKGAASDLIIDGLSVRILLAHAVDGLIFLHEEIDLTFEHPHGLGVPPLVILDLAAEEEDLIELQARVYVHVSYTRVCLCEIRLVCAQ